MNTRNFLAILSAAFAVVRLGSAAEDNAALPAEPTPGAGLFLNFHDAPLSAVVNYLSAKAGLIVDSEVDLTGKVSVAARQPVTASEAVDLLSDQLSRNNYAALRRGRTLTIMDASRARTSALTPLVVANDPAKIPVNNEIVTGILPVHALNPGQLAKDLEPLIPAADTVTANEAGNALLMTAPQKDVRRIAAIIAALDSTAISEIEVFVLTYADARSVAAELKEAFQSADAEVIRANPRRFGRGVAAGFNPADGGAGADPNSKNAQTHAVFVSDEQMNAVIASAPPGAMPMITNVIAQLDKPSQDITEIEIFPLQHADPTEIADQISALFAAPAGTSDQNSRTAGFQFGPPGMASPSSGRANESNRLKRQASVCAVADRRTQSVAITASRTSMTTIRGLIAKWDEGDKDMRFVSIFPIDSADPAVMQAAVGALFGGSQNQPALQTPLSLRPGNTAGSQSPATGPAGGLGFGSGSGAGAR